MWPAKLKCLRHSFQTKRHVQKFKKPERVNYSGLRNILHAHRNLVITAHQIHFRKKSCPLGEQKILDVQDGITVMHSDVVAESAAWPPRPIHFGHHMEG